MKIKSHNIAKSSDVTPQRRPTARGKTRKATADQKPTPAEAKPTRRTTPVEKLPDASQTKLSIVIAMLRTKQGANLDELVKATGWQKHSVRGAISGAIKKKRGLNVDAVRGDDGTTYRIVG